MHVTKGAAKQELFDAAMYQSRPWQRADRKGKPQHSTVDHTPYNCTLGIEIDLMSRDRISRSQSYLDNQQRDFIFRRSPIDHDDLRPNLPASSFRSIIGIIAHKFASLMGLMGDSVTTLFATGLYNNGIRIDLRSRTRVDLPRWTSKIDCLSYRICTKLSIFVSWHGCISFPIIEAPDE